MRGDTVFNGSFWNRYVSKPSLFPTYTGPKSDDYNAAASEYGLFIMLIIAGIWLPPVLRDTFSIYWIFRGKVRLNDHSY
jgi:cytochrome bd-type quinol oxidase subunit 2